MNTQELKVETLDANKNSEPIFEMKWWKGLRTTKVTCGGRQSRTDYEHRSDTPDFVIGAAGLSRETYIFGGDINIKGVSARRAVYIDWSDFGVPAIEEPWWRFLYQAISEIKPRHIHVQCVGGMGRTGTILTILYILSMKGKKDAPKTVSEAIGWIRSHGNPHAVETPAQRAYIGEMTGLPLV